MKTFHKKYHIPGTQPGIIEKTENTNCCVSLTQFNKDEHRIETLSEQSLVQVSNQFPVVNKITWIHIQGEPTKELLSDLSKRLYIHDLYAEDVINVGQRPKVEISEEQLFIILNLPIINNDKTKIEQVSLFVSDKILLSFCTGQFNPFEKVNNRLKIGTGKLRKQAVDYLAYALIDTIIDFGFPLLEAYSERIESLEDGLLLAKNKDMLGYVHNLRRELLLVRRRLWPQRELINELLRNEECNLLQKNTLVHLKDCYDHVLSIMEMLETYHEMTAGLMELYLTTVSMRLNDIMKFLTVFTTIFIPPTLLVGIYGMNFNVSASQLNMPELNWEFGYVAVWGLIVLMITGMLVFFKKKRWI